MIKNIIFIEWMNKLKYTDNFDNQNKVNNSKSMKVYITLELYVCAFFL